MQRFFAPGRTELAGNHTDHQLGRVLAASVDVGITARATRRRDRRVCIHSKGFRPFTVALDDLAVDPRAYGKPWALVRGMAALCPTHYASEAYGFYKFYQKIAEAAGIPCFFSGNDALL